MPAQAQVVAKKLTRAFNNCDFPAQYVFDYSFFTADAPEATLTFSRTHVACSERCQGFPPTGDNSCNHLCFSNDRFCPNGWTCGACIGTGCTGPCVGGVDVLVGYVVVLKANRFCEIAACASLNPIGCPPSSCDGSGACSDSTSDARRLCMCADPACSTGQRLCDSQRPTIPAADLAYEAFSSAANPAWTLGLATISGDILFAQRNGNADVARAGPLPDRTRPGVRPRHEVVDQSRRERLPVVSGCGAPAVLGDSAGFLRSLMRRAGSFAAIFAATLAAGAGPIGAQNVTQALTTSLNGRSYQPTYIRFTAQGSEAILNLSRVNGRCASTTPCVSVADCSAFPGATCSGSPQRCQVPIDALVGQVAVVEAARLCELAACAGVSLGAVCSGSEICPAGQTHCGTPGSCHTCPAALALCLCDGQSTCDEPDATLGAAGVPLADGFDNGANPNMWLLDGAQLDNTTLDSRLVLGPGAALVDGASVAVAGTRFHVSAGTDYVLVLKHAVNPRQSWAQCFPPGSMSVFLTSRAPRWCDLDDDGFSGTDCAPANGQAWAVPGEPAGVSLSISGGVTTLAWAAPSSPGGTPAGTLYRVYGGSRSDLPAPLER